MQNIRYANFDDYELILRIDDSISKIDGKLGQITNKPYLPLMTTIF